MFFREPVIAKNIKKWKREGFIVVIFRTSAIAAVAGMAGGIPAAGVPRAKRKDGRKFRVIDYRCRPPLKQFGGLYKMRLGYIAPVNIDQPTNKATELDNMDVQAIIWKPARRD